MTTPVTRISIADLKDAEVLERISVDTFEEAFAEQNTREDMELFLKECFNLNAIKKEISDPTIRYYMAFINDEIAGYVKVSKRSHPDLSPNSLELTRIYVYEKYHGKKVGAALMQFVIELARKEAFDLVWLGVWELNPKAIAFYKQWGFEMFGNQIFKLGTDIQNDFLMRKYL